MNVRPYSASFDPSKGVISMAYGRGLGDGSCGDNPCGFLDSIYASEACVNYQCCTQPDSFTCNALRNGAWSALKTSVGQATASAADPTPFLQGMLSNPTGAIVAVALGGLLLWMVLSGGAAAARGYMNR